MTTKKSNPMEEQPRNITKSIIQFIKDTCKLMSIFIFISFVFMQGFKIPSGSMIPTLLVGDFLLVDKFTYGYSNDSFRMWGINFPLPHFKDRILVHQDPQQGDVVVFRNTKDDDKDYIKRLIGMPGDKIQIINGIVHINDKPCELKEDGEYSVIDRGEYIVYKKYIEKLPNGNKHVIIKIFDLGKGHLDNVGPFIVPKDHYFMMGDNRDNSQDSRVMDKVGFISKERIIGKAKWIFFSSSCKLWEVFKWPFSLRFDRFFTKIL